MSVFEPGSCLRIRHESLKYNKVKYFGLFWHGNVVYPHGGYQNIQKYLILK